jgi:hypothetical protein
MQALHAIPEMSTATKAVAAQGCKRIGQSIESCSINTTAIKTTS